jgi:hypothetical protein
MTLCPRISRSAPTRLSITLHLPLSVYFRPAQNAAFHTQTSNMSWMDSWSRPNKHATTPPPLYLTVGDTVPYCHSCGRVISERRKTHGATEVKYCSTRCRNNKPGPLDRRIEAAFAALLDGAAPESLKDGAASNDEAKPTTDAKDGKKHKKKASKSTKGDHRPIIDCNLVEEIMFQREKDPEKVYGRRKNRKARFVVEKPEDWRSVDMVDLPAPEGASTPQPQPNTASDSDSVSDSEDEREQEGGIVLETTKSPFDPSHLPDEVEYGYGSGKVRPPQSQNDVNGSVGGEKGWAERIDETEEMKMKRREGQRRAEEREMVKKAARRGCAFGFLVEVDEEEKREVRGKGGKDKASKDGGEVKVDSDRRKCEAVMKGVVVEASFAKGDWGIRWREKV